MLLFHIHTLIYIHIHIHIYEHRTYNNAFALDYLFSYLSLALSRRFHPQNVFHCQKAYFRGYINSTLLNHISNSFLIDNREYIYFSYSSTFTIE